MHKQPARSRLTLRDCLSFRDPAWRWTRALTAWETICRRPRRSTDDAWVIAAAELMRERRRGTPVRRTAALQADVAAAIAIRAGDRWRRQVFEARLLARQTYDEIETSMGIKERDAIAYERLFFDFRPRLSARDWMHAYAVRCDSRYGLGPSLGALMRKFGYYGGPFLLDYLVDVVERYQLHQHPHLLHSVVPQSERDARALAALRLEILPWGAGPVELLQAICPDQTLAPVQSPETAAPRKEIVLDIL